MNKPFPIETFEPADLKLGIKSSLPNVKATLALLVLLWEADPSSSSFVYGEQVDNGLVLEPNRKRSLLALVNPYLLANGIGEADFVNKVNENQLLKSQLEALIVAFELVWRLAEINFVDTSLAASAERTSGVRYPKVISLSSNIDLIDAVIKGNKEEYLKVLIQWLGFSLATDSTCEATLKNVFTIMSEGAVFKMSDSGEDVVFNEDGIYRRLLERGLPVNVTGDKEPKGPLRILRSSLSEGMNPHLTYDTQCAASAEPTESLDAYHQRVVTFAKLNTVDLTKALQDTPEDDPREAIKAKYASEGYVYADEEVKYQRFASLYGRDALSALQGKDLLLRLFAPQSDNPDSLIYNLEHASYYKDFGGIGGGSSFKFPLFFHSKNKKWTTGSSKSPKYLSEADAISLAESVRDKLLALLDQVDDIENRTHFADVRSYEELKLFIDTDNVYRKQWVYKYLHMLYPNRFSCFFGNEWLKHELRVLDVPAQGSAIVNNGLLSIEANALSIENVFFYWCISSLFPLSDDVDDDNEDDDENSSVDLDTCKRLLGAENTILYGVPGAGKSYTIKHDYCDDEARMERVVFHPDYTYSDFVGQILPVVEDSEEGTEGKIIYVFVPGPFTKILKKAYQNPDVKFFLIIEEINRGNAPAIFGDVFQLLDRKSSGDRMGESEYGITNSDIAKEVYSDPNHMVRIPSNLSILCTMNTSDQNVFTLDTAFQRRWNMRLIENTFRDTDEESVFAQTKILDTSCTWKDFCEKINEIILNKNVRMTSSEDKRLGTHFVTAEDLRFVPTEGLTGQDLVLASLQNRRFPEKVIKYLWDDAFKFNREEIFDIGKYNSLESVIRKFIGSKGDQRFDIFLENIRDDLVKDDPLS